MAEQHRTLSSSQDRHTKATLREKPLVSVSSTPQEELDKDDDYLPLHEALAAESQRYTLARSCPINLFDLPFGPADVDPDDPSDLLAEFFDNSLMTGLSLLVTDEETKLSKGEEAYLMSVARAVYKACGITSEAIRQRPDTLLLPAPALADFIATLRTMPASSENLRQFLLERLEKAAYLFIRISFFFSKYGSSGP